jgi:hypothetical protein
VVSLVNEATWRAFPGSYRYSLGLNVAYFFDW